MIKYGDDLNNLWVRYICAYASVSQSMNTRLEQLIGL
jgi:hypothetical protein